MPPVRSAGVIHVQPGSVTEPKPEGSALKAAAPPKEPKGAKQVILPFALSSL